VSCRTRTYARTDGSLGYGVRVRMRDSAGGGGAKRRGDFPRPFFVRVAAAPAKRPRLAPLVRRAVSAVRYDTRGPFFFIIYIYIYTLAL
jgi:hypothetical protein